MSKVHSPSNQPSVMRAVGAAPAGGAGPAGHEDEGPLEAVVDDAIDQSDGECVTLGALLEAWGDRSYGPLLIILGFFAGTPLAVVPGAAAVVGVLITLIAMQMAVGLHHPWLPRWALDRSVKEKDLVSARRKAAKPLAFIDRFITERWAWASSGIARRAAALVVAALGLAMVPFDAIPFAVAVPAWTVVVFGVAITARDGLVMALALALSVGVGALAFRVF